MSVEKGGPVRRLEAASSAAPLRSSKARLAALAAAAVLLAAVAAAGLRFGSVPVTAADAFDALFRYSPESYEQTVVRFLRLPRTVIGLGAGAALAVAGAALQATTRNPLATPIRVNAGAVLSVVAVYSASYILNMSGCLAGGLGAAAVYAIGPRSGRGHAGAGPGGRGGRAAPQLVAYGDPALQPGTLDVVRFWLAGRWPDGTFGVLCRAAFMAVGMTGCRRAEQMNAEHERGDRPGAGMHTGRARLIVGGLSGLMVGGAVAAAGPIGSCWRCPHIVRGLVGPDYRWVSLSA